MVLYTQTAIRTVPTSVMGHYSFNVIIQIVHQWFYFHHLSFGPTQGGIDVHGVSARRLTVPRWPLSMAPLPPFSLARVVGVRAAAAKTKNTQLAVKCSPV